MPAGYLSGLRLEIEGQRDVRTRHGLLRGRNIDGTAVLNNTKDVDTLQFSIFGKSLVVAAAKHCTATVSRTTFRMISALQCRSASGTIQLLSERCCFRNLLP